MPFPSLRTGGPQRLFLSYSLAWLALVIHASAFLMLGRTNDESFYLAAIHNVSAGLVPYRDFCFPQGPLLPYAYAMLIQLLPGGRLLAARLVSLAILLASVKLLAGLASRTGGRRAAMLVVGVVVLNPYAIHHLTLVKTYALVSFLLILAVRCLDKGPAGFTGAAAALSLATATRLVAAPVLVWLFVWGARRMSITQLVRAGLVAVTVLAFTLGAFELASEGRLHASLYVPLAGTPGLNEVTAYQLAVHQPDDFVSSVDRKLSHLLRSLLAFGLPLVVLLPTVGTRLGVCGLVSPRPPAATFAGGAAALLAVTHMLAHRPYDEYQTVTFFPLIAYVVLSIRFQEFRLDPGATCGQGWRRAATWTLTCAVVLSPIWRSMALLDLNPSGPVALRVSRAGESVRRWTRPGTRVLALDAIVSVESGRDLDPLLAMGQFAYRPGWDSATCARNGFVNAPMLIESIQDRRYGTVLLADRDLLDGPVEQASWLSRLRQEIDTALQSQYEFAGIVPGSRPDRPLVVWRLSSVLMKTGTVEIP